MAPCGICEMVELYETVNTYVVGGVYEDEIIEQKEGYGIPVSIKRKSLKGFPDNRSALLKRQTSGSTGKSKG
jgi:hypothetical protein